MRQAVQAVLDDKAGTDELITVDAGALVVEAVAVMADRHVGAVLVRNEDGLVDGIFTERDLLTRVVTPGLDPRTTPVTCVMSPLLYMVDPTVTLDKAMTLISEQRTRHLPVLENGKLVGLISIGDINKWVVERLQHEAESLRSYISGQYPS